MICELLLEGILWRGQRSDVAIADGRFAAIVPQGSVAFEAKERIDCAGFLLRPPFYNTHTHHAMTLLRGIDDDCALMDWLERCIWPREAKLTARHVYAGARLALLESIRSGCVAFNDMYCHQSGTLQAAMEMGVRGRLGIVYQIPCAEHMENDVLREALPTLPARLAVSIAPHALYTTTPEMLREAVAEADRLGLPMHIHAAETDSENVTARERFGATSAIAYLESCGVLRPNTIVAHGCHLSESDLDLLAKHQCVIAHCPQSNQKLASGTFSWERARKAGVRVTVGTDGAASNNGLSMIAEAKAAALNAKLCSGRPDVLSVEELSKAVTEVAAEALGFPQAGRIAEGAEADALLIRLDHPAFAGGGNPDANFLYAADSACIDSVLCQGRFLMRHGSVPHEAEILSEAREAAADLAR